MADSLDGVLECTPSIKGRFFAEAYHSSAMVNSGGQNDAALTEDPVPGRWHRLSIPGNGEGR